jgi:hypothetical protein
MIKKFNLIHNKNKEFLNKIINQSVSVVKMVDTKDLNPLPFWECQLESGRGHHK